MLFIELENSCHYSSHHVIYKHFLHLILLGVIYMTIRKYKYTYDKEIDKVHWILLTIPALVLGGLIHPGLNNSYVSDVK